MFIVKCLLIIFLPLLIWQIPLIKKYVPRVVIYILFGLLMGPSFLGIEVFKDTSDLQGLSTFALILFGFLTGVHLDLKELEGKGKAFAFTAAGSMVIPFILCGLLGIWMYNTFPELAGTKANMATFSFACAVLGSVTALPVLGTLLKELNMMHSPVGRLSIAIATVNDAVLWILVAILLAVANSGSFMGIVLNLVLSVVYFLFMFKVVSPWLKKMVDNKFFKHDVCDRTFSMVVGLTFVSALITEELGLHYLLGAFTAGVILPKELSKGFMTNLERVVDYCLVPFFFVVTGLKTTFMANDPVVWLVFVLVLLISTVGKVVGTSIPAYFWLIDKNKYQASTIGAFASPKGMMEVAVLVVLMSNHLITDKFFAAFLLMAVFSTVMVKPWHMITVRMERKSHHHTEESLKLVEKRT